MLSGKPTKIAIGTTSGYLMDSANYRDLIILNGGIRFDEYNNQSQWIRHVGRGPRVYSARKPATS